MRYLSWAQTLYETYNQNEEFIGKKIDGVVLMPIAHTTQNSHIEIILDEKGNFHLATIVLKEDAKTIIPCTVESANRSGTKACLVPQPLFDKLYFMARDFKLHTKHVDKKNSYDVYMKQLSAWCDSGFANEDVKLLRTYLQHNDLVHDLIKSGILYCDNEGILYDKWPSNTDQEAPPIFKNATEQSDLVIRFCILRNETIKNIWEDRSVQESFINYYLPTITKTDICYVTGEQMQISDMHPAKLRNTGDKAKLISTNDTNGFTYRGIMQNDNQCISLGYETSQKIHNAMKWLIERQGIRFAGDLVYIAWGTNRTEVIDPFEDTDELYGSVKDDIERLPSTFQEYSKNLNLAIKGYKNERFKNPNEKIVLMGVDSATTGRLSIVYYQEILGSDFLKRIEYWHMTCSWLFQVKFKYLGKDEKEKIKFKRTEYTGAPTLQSIVQTAYGNHVKDPVMKTSIRRLITCVLEQKTIPKDIVDCIFNRLTRRGAFTKEEYDTSLHIGCAVIRKYLNDISKKEEWKMELDLTQKDTEYLWGRLLAYAHEIESYALYITDKEGSKGRETNAVRYMNQFQMRPVETWKKIFIALRPYIRKLEMNEKTTSTCYGLESGINEIVRILEDRKEKPGRKPLNASFILGYGAQLDEFRIKKNTKKNENIEREEN